MSGTPLRPHRGTLILVFGILSLVVCGFFLGIPAWIMGNADLRAMAAGEMDRSGEGLTKAGKICGMIAVILDIVGILVGGLLLLLFVIVGASAAAAGAGP